MNTNKDDKIKLIQDDVNTTIEVMNNNIKLITNRDVELGQLEDSTEYLQEESHRFQKTARKVKNKFCCKNIMNKTYLALLILILLIVIIIIIASVRK